MKTATLPAVRVTPQVRALAESVLKEGETLSMFVEDSVRKQAQMREEDRAFYARGMASLERVRAGEKTYTAAQSMARLLEVIERKKAEKAVLAAKKSKTSPTPVLEEPSRRGRKAAVAA